jgi:hypothetical protein
LPFPRRGCIWRIHPRSAMSNTRHIGQPETLFQFIHHARRRVGKAVRRFLIRRELAATRYECDCIQRQREEDLQIERLLTAREVMLRAELKGH